MTKILVLGGDGQVGWELRHRAWPQGVEIVAPGRSGLDICSAEALKRHVSEEGVAAIVNAAAYTAVDKAETELAAAFSANAVAPAAMAEAAKDANIPLVHVSTDYVFDGAGTAPYEVDAPVAPIGVYGASKAAGEYAVRLGWRRSAIVRTAWVVSSRRANFVKTMLRVGQANDTVRVVADQQGAPTMAADLADALGVVTLKMIADEAAPAGLFHFSNAGPTTWRDFAAAIFEVAASRGLKTPNLVGITTAEYPTPARRPAYSVLSTARIERDYGVVPPPWRERLPGLIDDILTTAS